MKKILFSKVTFFITAFSTVLFIFFFYWTFLKLDSVGLGFLDKVGVYILIYLYFPVFWVSSTMLSGLSENAALMVTVFLLPLLWSYTTCSRARFCHRKSTGSYGK